MSKFIRLFLGAIPAVLIGFLATPAGAQPVTCTTSGIGPVVRSDGLAEPLGDFFLSCTGGIPTSANLPVPQINVTIFLNSNITSKIAASDSTGTYSEALLLVDEPNSGLYPNGRPVLNCGQTGAPDNGPSGPGVCGIVSDGTPADTYSGTPNAYGTHTCDALNSDPKANSYSCGRPNAFQGRLPTGGQGNVIEFLGVPFDPPGAGTRYLRITNLRANAYLLGAATPPAVTQINATVSVTGSTSFSIATPTVTIGFSVPGIVPGGCGTPAASTVRVCEGFASSLKTKNLSLILANATYTGTSYQYTSGAASYPADEAQNVPGTLYNTESMFEWHSPFGPPAVNPPLGFGAPVPNLGFPLNSVGYGGTNTNPEAGGLATAGTRLALRFSDVPSGATLHVPLTVNLYRVACSPCTPSGVLVLTKADAAGGGTFNAATSTAVGASHIAVYEVLYADPFAIEYGDVAYTVTGGSSAGVKVSPTFAPFYNDAASAKASKNGDLPRFEPLGAAGMEALIGTITSMNLAKGITNSLENKLNTAVSDLANGNVAGACSRLASLITEATAQSGKKLTVTEANTIINAAMALQTQLGC